MTTTESGPSDPPSVSEGEARIADQLRLLVQEIKRDNKSNRIRV